MQGEEGRQPEVIVVLLIEDVVHEPELVRDSVAGGPLADAVRLQPPCLHLRRAPHRHGELLTRQLPRLRRVRPGLQGRRRRQAPPRAHRTGRGREVPRPRLRHAGPQGVAGRGFLPGATKAQEPGETDRVLLRGRAPDAGVRVHECREPGEPPLQKY